MLFDKDESFYARFLSYVSKTKALQITLVFKVFLLISAGTFSPYGSRHRVNFGFCYVRYASTRDPYRHTSCVWWIYVYSMATDPLRHHENQRCLCDFRELAVGTTGSKPASVPLITSIRFLHAPTLSLCGAVPRNLGYREHLSQTKLKTWIWRAKDDPPQISGSTRVEVIVPLQKISR